MSSFRQRKLRTLDQMQEALRTEVMSKLLHPDKELWEAVEAWGGQVNLTYKNAYNWEHDNLYYFVFDKVWQTNGYDTWQFAARQYLKHKTLRAFDEHS